MKEDPCPTHTGIMSDQGLLYQARKSFVAKKKAFAAEAMPKWQTMKDAADYQDMLRLEQRQKAELAGENVGKPKLKTSSPTILLKNTQD